MRRARSGGVEQAALDGPGVATADRQSRVDTLELDVPGAVIAALELREVLKRYQHAAVDADEALGKFLLEFLERLIE